MRFEKEFSGFPYVFRFRSPSKWTISELEEGYVYFANRNELNDPHDSNPKLVQFTKNTTDLKKFYEFIGSSFPDEESKEDFLKNYTPEKLRDFMTEKIEFYVLHFGVVCFSMHLKNFPLWANYAENSSGLCLQFNVEKDKNLFNNLRPIEYIPEPNQIIYNPNSEKKTLAELFFQKTSDWGFEKELRLLKIHNGRHFFKKEALEKVILGYKSKPEFVEKVRKIVHEKYPETQVFLMKEPTEFDKISLSPL
jgi:hypothetical protein